MKGGPGNSVTKLGFGVTLLLTSSKEMVIGIPLNGERADRMGQAEGECKAGEASIS